MDSAEYERKTAARFASFDQDGNGYIDREDFSAAAAAILAEFDTTARCDKGQALYSGAEAFWQGMAGIADVDGDQRVTRGEFVTGAVKRLRDNPERFAEIARPFLHAAIEIAAASDGGDEGVTVGAATRLLRVLGADQEAAERVATALDADGDGIITESETLSAFAVYYTVDGPDTQ
ncbi:EF-hand domain-containing protein [Streptomyces sp. NPDC091272]|uniref:EF-hand domain-containing protein n=1 Tax=Streptomyces sp. NPDC091272 TaxID=3365981 RepID=UPI0037F62947